MAFSDDDSTEWIESEQKALHRRLQRLAWPQASDEVRRRCWEEIGVRLADQPRTVPGKGRDAPRHKTRPDMTALWVEYPPETE